MDFDIKVGDSYELKYTVEKKDTAKSIASGGLDVFASPVMFGLMEEACFMCVDDKLGDMTTVGISISSTHLAPTPIGMEVTVKATLREIDRKRLVFDVVASDEVEEIGRGSHERFIIDPDKFLAKIQKKFGK